MDILQWIMDNCPAVAGIAFIASLVFQVSKIPINPYGWIIKKISLAITNQTRIELERITKEKKESDEKILEEITQIKKNMDDMYESFDLDKIERIRGEILTFADSVRAGGVHSREQYHHIIERNTEYHELIKKRGISNGVLELAMQAIENDYIDRDSRNDFVA